LASSKIHCVNSTAKGEIAYARYVYAYTHKDDTAIRAPVANFWATRSHTLRAEAEDEFRQMCLEFPQFVYDVLSKLLLTTITGCVYTNGANSACLGREAQAREARQNAPLLFPHTRQRSKEVSGHLNLSWDEHLFLGWSLASFRFVSRTFLHICTTGAGGIIKQNGLAFCESSPQV
jgi:hypothetical protein